MQSQQTIYYAWMRSQHSTEILSKISFCSRSDDRCVEAFLLIFIDSVIITRGIGYFNKLTQAIPGKIYDKITLPPIV